MLQVFGLWIRIKIMNKYVLLRFIFAEILALSISERRTFLYHMENEGVFHAREGDEMFAQ